MITRSSGQFMISASTSIRGRPGVAALVIVTRWSPALSAFCHTMIRFRAQIGPVMWLARTDHSKPVTAGVTTCIILQLHRHMPIGQGVSRRRQGKPVSVPLYQAKAEFFRVLGHPVRI